MRESVATRCLAGVLWGTLALGTALVLLSSVPYLLPGGWHPFLAERPQLSSYSPWRTSLTIHVIGGAFCLLAGLFLLPGRAVARWPRAHGRLGRLYVWVLAATVFPTGAYLALFAKGGAWASTGFLLSDFVATAAALYAARGAIQRRLASHRDWMLRSYAQVSGAISFRIYHLVFQLAGVPYETNYLTSLWLSVLANALLAELIILTVHRRERRADRRRGNHAIFDDFRGVMPDPVEQR